MANAQRKEYRITGRFRKDEKRHVADGSWKWNLRDAELRLAELQHQSESEMKYKARRAVQAGMISVGTEYLADYDLLELRIESREVSPWEVRKDK